MNGNDTSECFVMMNGSLRDWRGRPCGHLNDLDLSPLARFIDEARGPLCFRAPKTDESLLALLMATNATVTRQSQQAVQELFSRKSPFSKYMGQAVDVVTPVAIDPSPLDKALEDFVARRKAKREQPAASGRLLIDTVLQRGLDDRKARELQRAMSRLAPHDTEIHERLMPYRGCP